MSFGQNPNKPHNSWQNLDDIFFPLHYGSYEYSYLRSQIQFSIKLDFMWLQWRFACWSIWFISIGNIELWYYWPNNEKVILAIAGLPRQWKKSISFLQRITSCKNMYWMMGPMDSFCKNQKHDWWLFCPNCNQRILRKKFHDFEEMPSES